MDRGVGTVFRGAQDVGLDVRIAGLGSRGLALVVDVVILVVAQLLLLLGLELAGLLLGDLLAGTLATAAALGVFLINWGYFLVFEAAWGATPGKALVGLRVVDGEGLPVGWAGAAIRNVVRYADFLPGGFTVGVAAMLLDRRWRRLGDLAAGTLVVIDPPEGAITVRRVPDGVGPAEIAWVERVVAMRRSPPPDRLHEVESELAAALLRRAPGLPRPRRGEPPATWIDRVFEPRGD